MSLQFRRSRSVGDWAGNVSAHPLFLVNTMLGECWDYARGQFLEKPWLSPDIRPENETFDASFRLHNSTVTNMERKGRVEQ